MRSRACARGATRSLVDGRPARRAGRSAASPGPGRAVKPAHPIRDPARASASGRSSTTPCSSSSAPSTSTSERNGPIWRGGKLTTATTSVSCELLARVVGDLRRGALDADLGPEVDRSASRPACAPRGSPRPRRPGRRACRRRRSARSRSRPPSRPSSAERSGGRGALPVERRRGWRSSRRRSGRRRRGRAAAVGVPGAGARARCVGAPASHRGARPAARWRVVGGSRSAVALGARIVGSVWVCVRPGRSAAAPRCRGAGEVVVVVLAVVVGSMAVRAGRSSTWCWRVVAGLTSCRRRFGCVAGGAPRLAA